jgi:hypothetical protein
MTDDERLAFQFTETWLRNRRSSQVSGDEQQPDTDTDDATPEPPAPEALTRAELKSLLARRIAKKENENE